ncbi:branched-chain amino acid ABC transporter permease [Klebsiella pneumoniae]|uniref:branched-chain amino acid ABC transporter permease n=1 Tax=Klebsiella pneumoniae TaxID=573 RepID=UPI0025538179|nr:branched-chain amino acid ABC transporter permease [Klebsiella pneumoniae]
MDGAIFLQQVVNGMSLGGMYALIAIGYTMVYGVLRLINFAHADVMMVGAFSTLFLFSSVGLPFGVAVFLTLGLCGLFGMMIDRVAYRPLRQASKISMLITAIGVSFFLENLFNVLFGGSSRFFSAPDFFNQTRAFGSVTGAVLGGFILGFTEVVAVAIFPELGGYKDAFAFLFLILVLLFRPVGIMGDERLERSRF